MSTEMMAVRLKGEVVEVDATYLAKRLWAKVDKPEEGCWNFVGLPGRQRSTRTRRYGWISLTGKPGTSVNAHVAAFALTRGGWPPAGMYVRHGCHNKRCCRPGHLILGTPQENSDDSKRAGHFDGIRGLGNPSGVLTDDQVLDARGMRAMGSEYAEIHTHFLLRGVAVAKTTLYAAITGDTHTYLPNIQPRRTNRPRTKKES